MGVLLRAVLAPGGFAFNGACGATLEERGEEVPSNGAVKGADGKEIEGRSAQAKEAKDSQGGIHRRKTSVAENLNASDEGYGDDCLSDDSRPGDNAVIVAGVRFAKAGDSLNGIQHD